MRSPRPIVPLVLLALLLSCAARVCGQEDAPRPPEPAAGATDQNRPADSKHPDHNKLLGTWEIVDARFDGKPHNADLDTQVTFADGKLITHRGAGKPISVDYSILPAQSPHWIDVTITDGDQTGTLLGVYTLKDGVLTVCLAAPGQDRPVAPSTTAGDHCLLHTMRRVRTDDVDTVAAIKKLGGLLEYDGFKRVYRVSFQATDISDSDLLHLKGLGRLRKLSLALTDISDDGLAHLSGLTDLISLHLSGTKISDSGLAALSDLQKLEHLTLSGTKVSDAGLVHLKTLTGLTTLYLRDTQVTDAGLKHLVELTRLKIVLLRGTKVSDEGAKRLRAAITGLEVVR